MTKRQAIETLRQELRERTADSKLSNQFLYNELLKQAKWLVKREVSGGRIYTNNSFFQTIGCMDVIEVPAIDECCPIKTNCKIYRTKNKLPEAWVDNDGAVIRSISSVDGSTDFFYTTSTSWSSKSKDPYQKMGKIKYAFFEDNYLWFPVNNPHKISISGYFVDELHDTDMCSECREKVDCVRFLDSKFMVPAWLEAEMYAKALQQIASITMRMQEDEQIDKNTNRKN